MHFVKTCFLENNSVTHEILHKCRERDANILDKCRERNAKKNVRKKIFIFRILKYSQNKKFAKRKKMNE